ncbi:type I polyketide synthase [Nonomuraea endophytica]|uniref:type I polyketide synthase n=1 Tax=Nonomuraea endophytica TaxID=714136 RepID=UPI0037CA6713
MGAFVMLDVVTGTGTVAIVGAACRLPGGIADLPGLSAMLAAGRDVVTQVPADRFDAARWTGSDQGRPGLAYTAAGGFLDDIAGFDAAFFGISPREAAQLDPQQRLLLELTVEAFDHAAIDPARLAGLAGGVFAGVSTRGYWELLAARPQVVDAHSMVGTITSHVANRISYLLDWRGPSLAIDTACSSALVAIHQAARAVAAGEVPIAVAAGVGLLLNPADYLGFCKAGLLSPSGRCRTFSAGADGFVRAEGGGVIVLKQLREALADGDRVLGVIAGSGVNTDGRSAPGGLTQPSPTAQQALLERVYRDAGVHADELVYLECHGTGTPVGDPVECAAIGAALGTRRRQGRPLPIGSIKTNIGHLECASGMAGLLKALLVLREGRIPPSLHTRPLNPAIAFRELGLVPVQELTGIEVDGPVAYAGVNSFGIGGTNAHILLSQWSPGEAPAPDRKSARRVPVVVSARTPAALVEAAWATADLLTEASGTGAGGTGVGGTGVGLVDVAHTSARRRRHVHTAVVLAKDAREAAGKLYRIAAGEPAQGTGTAAAAPGTRTIAYVFSGNGSQWQGMARELLEPGADPAFEAAVGRVCRALSPMLGWQVHAALRSGDHDLARTEIAQPLLFAVQVGLVAALGERGIEPVMVAGHSVGEIAAAHTAGYLDLDDACRVVAVRSAAQARTAGSGAMAAAALDEDAARSHLARFGGTVEISAVNSGSDVTLTGDGDALRQIGEHLSGRGVFFRMLPLNYAFHSAAMDPIRELIATELRDLSPGPGRLPMWSSVTGELLQAEGRMDGGYWWRNIREPVLFASAVEGMRQAGADVFVEIGPHPVLLTYLRRLGVGAPVGVMRRDQPPDLDAAAAGVIAAGGPVSHPPGGGRVVDLPAYPWQRERHWIGEPSWWNGGPGDGILVHPLLGDRVPVPGLVWSGPVEPARTPWLPDHQVGGAVVMPGAAYVEMALAAGAAADLTGHPQVRDLTVSAALTTTVAATLVTELKQGRFSVSSRHDRRTPQSWQEHARGQVSATSAAPPPPLNVQAITDRTRPALSGARFYAMTARAGTAYGPCFQTLTWVRAGEDGELLAGYDLPAAVAAELGRRSLPYHAHPVLLDAMVHAGGALLPQIRSGQRLFVPIEFGTVTLWRTPSAQGFIHVRALGENDREATWDVTLTCPDGHVTITMNSLRVRLIEGTASTRVGAWTIDRRPSTVHRQASPRKWTVVTDRGGASLGARVAELLDAAPGRPISADTTGLVLIIDGDPALASADDCARAGQLVRDLLTSGAGRELTIWVVTGPTGAAAGAAAWATSRTLANEQPAHTVRRIALTHDGPDAADQITALLRTDTAGEDEFIVGRDHAQVPRIVPVPLDPPPTNAPTACRDSATTVLRVRQVAMTPRLRWEPAEPLRAGPGQVLIEVRAAGLNYKDVMLATGMMPAEPGQIDQRGGDRDGAPLLGQECAGVVVAAGSQTGGLVAGQAVMAIAPGSLASHVVAEAAVTVPIPAGLGFTEAAAIPLVYSTAHYALYTLAGLTEGETVLVPAGAGGVGLAALELARLRGAHVIALAGTEAKRAYLRERGARHVFDSRSLAFADQVREVTGGRGVDVVLNSLTAAAATAALDLLAPDGRFVDLGKRDLYGDATMRLRPFLGTLSYFAVDLAQLIQRRPAIARDTLNAVAGLVAAGAVSPPPHRSMPAADVEEALAVLKRSTHIGKLVIDLATPPPPGRIAFDPDAGYLVTGGTRGFGAATARWLADHGARHVVVTGRTTLTEHAGLPEGSTVVVADAADPVAMTAAVQAAARAPAGLKGVFHCAAHYDDAPLADLTPDRFAAVLAPKVTGADLLDTLTRGADLDYFVLYSSIAALIGNRLQAAYGAANHYLDALAADRHRRGLPANSIAWGPIADLGVVARDGLTTSLTGLGLEPMPPHQALHALAQVLARGRDAGPYTVIARADWQRLAAMFPTCAAARYQTVTTSPATKAPDLNRTLDGATPAQAQAQAIVTEAITTLLATTIKIDPQRLDPGIPLDRLGVDSLLATELAISLRQRLDVNVPTLEILSSRGITDLSARLLSARAHRQETPR